jgi:surface protein
MSIMFAECKNLKTLNLKNFKTDKVTDMTWMFINNPSLTIIEVTDKWSTSSVKQSEAMFYGDAKLVGSMGTKYDAIHVDHEYAQIDGGLCDPGYLSGEYKNNNLIQPYAVLRDSILTFYYDHNKNCRDGIIYIVEDDYYHNGISDMKIPEWSGYGFHTATFDKSFANYKPTNLSCWFYYCGKLRIIEGVNNLVTSKVKDMSCMFYYCQQLRHIDLSSFATGCVTNMKEMFYYCKRLTDLNLNSFNTSNVTNMRAMFWMCSTLTKLDLSNFNTAKVIEMYAMFMDCYNIKEINLSSFNTSKVTKMNDMFRNCWKLKELDLSKFDTSNVKEMKEMFAQCNSLEKLDISNFDISNVKNLSQMFVSCSSLTTLDLSSFDTTNIEEIDGFFYWCKSLKTVYVSELWNLTKYRYAQVDGGNSNFFYQCINLEGGMGTKFDADNHTGPLYARIDEGASAPGYFTYKEAPVKRGDANCDGKVDVFDISAMANHITQNKYNDRADMNKDGKVNTTDLVLLINKIKLAQP